MSAYLPPTTAAARIGSVGVRQAAMAKDDKKFKPGIRAKISPAETTQPYEVKVRDEHKKRVGDAPKPSLVQGERAGFSNAWPCMPLAVPRR